MTIKNRRIVVSCVVDIFIVALFMLLSFAIIKNDSTREIYIKLLFLPVSAFVSGFFGVLMTRGFFINVFSLCAVHAIAFLIFASFSFWVLPWTLLYLVCGIPGFLMANISLTKH